MDSLTQATLGAAIGQGLLGKRIGYKGAIIGAIIATIPDLDIILLPFYDSIERISVHRGYSHSIAFSIVGALLIAFLLSKIKWTKQFSYARLLVFSWLALFTHMLLDAFTAYGTQLLLPFSDYRVSFDSVNIVDPLYTLPLIIGLAVNIYYQRKYSKWSKSNTIGLVVSSLYLMFTLANKALVSNSIATQLKQQKIEYNDLRSIPVGVGSINWYGVAKTQDTLYLGKYSYFSTLPIEFHSFAINDHLLQSINPRLADRLKWFSQGFYTVAEDHGKVRLYNLQCDMQGVRTFGEYKAPTAFYFEISPEANGDFKLSTGMHPKRIEK